MSASSLAALHLMGATKVDLGPTVAFDTGPRVADTTATVYPGAIAVGLIGPCWVQDWKHPECVYWVGPHVLSQGTYDIGDGHWVEQGARRYEAPPHGYRVCESPYVSSRRASRGRSSREILGGRHHGHAHSAGSMSEERVAAIKHGYAQGRSELRAMGIGAADPAAEERFNLWMDSFLGKSESLQRGELLGLAAKEKAGTLTDDEKRHIGFARNILGVTTVPDAGPPPKGTPTQTIALDVVGQKSSLLPMFLAVAGLAAVGIVVAGKSKGA